MKTEGLKIVFFVHRYWPNVGGVEKYIHRLAQAFQAMGHFPSVVAGAYQEGLPEHEQYEGVDVYRYPAYRSPARSMARLLKLRRLFQESDVIHVSDTFMLEYYIRMIGWSLPDHPLFLTRHGLSYIHPVPDHEKRRAIRSLELVDGIVHDGYFIERHLGVAPDIVPNQGLWPEAQDLPEIPEPAPDRATFVGRMDSDGGIQAYVDAIRLLRDQYGLTIHLDAYGHGELEDKLKQQVKEESLPVTFHGWQEDAQERVSDGCFAFIDGRMAMQEAMARKRLVIAAWTYPLKEDYITCEPFSPYLACGGDAETIASHVAWFATHDKERLRRTQEAYEYASTLSWQRTAEEYLTLWETAPRRDRRLTEKLKMVQLSRHFARESRKPREELASEISVR